ncbi:MAG: hypothetical protein CMM14_08080 [Rhodospirillaceae bacterium]|nr:hypothetical protein [Rhodospirillaceae bacterium]
MCLISSCSNNPFVDGRRNAGSTESIGPSNLDRVAICYNYRFTEPEKVVLLATSECEKTNRKPIFEKNEAYGCSIINPSRAYFRCIEK